MSQATRAVTDGPSDASKDGLEWVPREIAETPSDPPLFRRFAPTKRVKETPPKQIPPAEAPTPNPAAKVVGDGIDAEVAHRLDLAEASIAQAGRAVEETTLALAELLGAPGQKS